jgi:hypothetical protein
MPGYPWLILGPTYPIIVALPHLHVNRHSDQLSVHVARMFGDDQAKFRLVGGGDLHPIWFDALHAAVNLPYVRNGG